jgi:hypothetical protein
VFEVPEVISAPQIWARPIAVLAADSFGVPGDLQEDGFLGRGQDRGGPDGAERHAGRLGGMPGAHVGGREQAFHDGADPQRRDDRDHGPPAARRVDRGVPRRPGFGQLPPGVRGGGCPGRADPARVADDGQPSQYVQQQDDQRRGDVVAVKVDHVVDQGDRVLRRKITPMFRQYTGSR